MTAAAVPSGCSAQAEPGLASEGVPALRTGRATVLRRNGATVVALRRPVGREDQARSVQREACCGTAHAADRGAVLLRTEAMRDETLRHWVEMAWRAAARKTDIKAREAQDGRL